MEYQEFFERIKADLKQALLEKLQNVEIGERQVDKLQGESYHGLEVRPEGSKAAMLLDLRSIYGEGVDENHYEEALGRVAATVMENMEFPHKSLMENLTDYGVMKDKLIIQMIGKEGNEEMLAKIPYRDFEDLAMVYRFMLDVEEKVISSVLVTDTMMKTYGVTEEQLHEEACRNMVEKDDMVIVSMNDMLEDLTGIPASESPLNPMPIPLYVATNQSKQYGASVMEHPDFAETAADKLGGNYFIIPSSVHELLLLPDDGYMELQAIEEMLAEVNATQVKPEQRLSNTVYHYDTETGRMETARGYEKRMDMERKSVLETLKEKQRSLPERIAGNPVPYKMPAL